MSAQKAREARTAPIAPDPQGRVRGSTMRHVLMLLGDMARPGTHLAWPSRELMAGQLLMSPSRVLRAVHALADQGLVREHAAGDPPPPPEYLAIPAHKRPRLWVVLPAGVIHRPLAEHPRHSPADLEGVAVVPPLGVAVVPPKAETVSEDKHPLDTQPITRAPGEQPQPVDICCRCGRYAPRMGSGEHTPHTARLPDGTPVPCLPAERAQVDAAAHAQLARGLIAHARSRPLPGVEART